MDNSAAIFTLALGLASPWTVQLVSFEPDAESGAQTLIIHLDFPPGSTFSLGVESGLKVHDTHARTWRHLNFFQHPCYIHARIPRVRTADGKVRTVEVPWARPGSGFTLLFEAFSMKLIESEMPVSKAAALMGEYPNRLWNIFDYWIGIAYSEADHSGITRLAIDETSVRKGHNYVTVVTDLDKARVVKAIPGKGEEAIAVTAAYLEDKGSPAGNVEQVCIDMSPAYISGCGQHFPKASITFDRFHVVAVVNKAMDELRRGERKDFALLKGHRYLFLTADKHLSAQRRAHRQELLEALPALAKGYRLKELFELFWDMKEPEEAAAYLSFWCDHATDSKLYPFVRAAATMRAHWSGIVAYIKSGISNGIAEGINSKIQLAKRRARGYANIDNFINMIYFTCGKLRFNYPHYSA